MLITLMGNDAGSKHYGYSVVRFYINKKKNIVKYRILECGELINTLHDLKDGNHKEKLENYEKEISDKIKKYKVEAIQAERYMPRGMFGNTSEFVNIMYGYLNAQKTPVKFITASTWKNRVSKYMGGKEGLNLFYKVVGTEDHEVDATLQAAYLAEKISGVDVLPTMLSTQKQRLKLQGRIEKCTTSKLKNRQNILVL